LKARLCLQTEQITAEYKVQALQFHPDKNEGNKEAEAKFQKLKVRIVT
jgi:DnaJ family protein C protein 12